jgi:hypothetical protein
MLIVRKQWQTIDVQCLQIQKQPERLESDIYTLKRACTKNVLHTLETVNQRHFGNGWIVSACLTSAGKQRKLLLLNMHCVLTVVRAQLRHYVVYT